MTSDFKILPGKFKKITDSDLCFVFFNGSMLVKRAEKISIPTVDEVKRLQLQYENEFFIGMLKDRGCFAIQPSSEIECREGFELISLHSLGALLQEELFLIAERANQILHWDKTHRFCGRCGSKTEDKSDEMAKVCPECGHVMYPVICPAIIVGIVKEDKILLAHNKNFKDNRYSVIAGFVEAGESLESAVQREVFEEVGIKVKNIRYFMSAPWSFPNSLMLGFFADYESGDIKVDGEEILHADWFTKDSFPNIPQKHTIARKIIDAFTGERI